MELVGKVVGTKLQKTTLVEVEDLVTHPLYKKRVRKSKKYQVHDEFGVKIGDKVKIESCRPISKNKHFRIKEVIGS